jgi:hypothetical protein
MQVNPTSNEEFLNRLRDNLETLRPESLQNIIQQVTGEILKQLQPILAK